MMLLLFLRFVMMLTAAAIASIILFYNYMNINSQSLIDNERLTNQKLELPETAGYQTLFNSSNVLFEGFLLYIYALYATN